MYSKQVIDPRITHVKVGVGIIIVDESGRILLEKRSDNGMWGLPGGAVEPGESVRQTALREAKEETGLDIEITGLVGVYSEPFEGRIATYPDNGDIRHLVDIVLIAEMISGQMVISGESLDLRFFNPDSFPTELVPPAKKPLRDFVAGTRCVIS
jgi:8-oxo-dGTP pyrophosphatase MutT (NUDIX family)